MSRIITIGSQKGGSGKTTTALNLGYSLGRMAGRTLVVDLDPQGGISLASNLRNHTTRGLVDVLRGDASAGDVAAEARDGSMSVAGIGVVDPGAVQLIEQSAWNGVLAGVLRELAEGFRYTLIDAPAGLGGGVRAALTVSDGAIVPADCQGLTLKSLPLFLNLIDHVASERAGVASTLRLDGILINRYDKRSETEREVRSQLMNVIPEDAFFRTVIPHHEAFVSSSLTAIPAVLQQEAPEIARLYLELALEVRERETRDNQASVNPDEPPRLF